MHHVIHRDFIALQRESQQRRTALEELPAHPAHREQAAAPVERTEAIRSSRIDPHDPQALLAAQAQLVNQALDVAEHAVDHRTQLAAIGKRETV